MVFTVACPDCNSEFPVDPAKVPEGGVVAQCTFCPGTFQVLRPEPVIEAAPPMVALVPDAPASEVPDPEPAHEPAHEPTREPAQESVTEAAPMSAAVADPPAFGSTDPDARAARLARVLVSDMMTYNPALYSKAVDAGTLVQDFEEEVKRSWSEYVEQIGEELARSTPHFANALNDILAQGDPLFDESMFE